MAENKKSFVLYADLLHTVKKMPKEKAGELLLTILSYVNDENPVIEDLLVDLAFEPIKQQLKRDLVKWSDRKVNKSENGVIGNLKRWNKDLYDKVIAEEMSLDEAIRIAKHRKASLSDKIDRTVSQRVANVAVNDNVTVNVNDTVINNKAKAFVAGATQSDELVSKKEYLDIQADLLEREPKERWVLVRDFIRDRKPSFIEPYFDAWNIFAMNIQLNKDLQQITDKRRKKFNVRIREPDFKNRFLEILEKIKSSPFAKGENTRGWKIGIEFILESQENYTKILENRYDF